MDEGAHLGGSAANVAYHAAMLGAESRLVSRVGADALGGSARKLLAESGVQIDDVTIDPEVPTGTVTVEMLPAGPRFIISDLIACDNIPEDAKTLARVRTADVLCFSTLAQRTARMRKSLSRLVESLQANDEPGPLRILDLNLRPPFTDPTIIHEEIRLADILKLNEEELSWLERQCRTTRGVEWLFDNTRLRVVLLTRAERGASLHTREEQFDVAGLPACGGDPVGAGDSFVAAFACSLASGAPLARALEDANRHAAWVAGEIGAMPKKAPTPPVR